jgi:hypothetical protein
VNEAGLEKITAGLRHKIFLSLKEISYFRFLQVFSLVQTSQDYNTDPIFRQGIGLLSGLNPNRGPVPGVPHFWREKWAVATSLPESRKTHVGTAAPGCPAAQVHRAAGIRHFPWQLSPSSPRARHFSKPVSVQSTRSEPNGGIETLHILF